MDGPYLLFEGDIYYPRGGARDFVAAFPTIEAAKAAAAPIDPNGAGSWAHIADALTMRVVCESKQPYYEAGPRVWIDVAEEKSRP